MASAGENVLSHICVAKKRNYPRLFRNTLGGYRQDLLENILSPLERSLIVCCSCEGVMRDPQLTEKGYKCRSCLDGGEGKPATVNKTEIEKLRAVCPFREQGCDWSGTIGLVVSHVEKCDLCPVSCPLGCGRSLARKDLKRHEKEECPERNTKCEFCLTTIKVSQRCEHRKKCPDLPLKCSNGCGKDRIPRKEMSLHVTESCPLTMVPCPYKKYGCVGVKRKDTDRHEMEFVVKHVRMMSTHNELMSTHIETLCTQIETLKTDTNTRMDEICTAITPNKGLEWEIKGVGEKFEKKTDLLSDPFYVNSYKLKGLAYFNTEDNNSLGIYLYLCVGILDDSLRWPFLGEVTMTLINLRNSDQSETRSFLTEDTDVFTRPTEDTTGWGWDFTTKDEVLTKFSKEDSIQIKIEIENLNKPDEFAKRVNS